MEGQRCGYIGIRLGWCSCSGVEPILWGSDGGIDFLVGLWSGGGDGGAFRGGVWWSEGE